jgi:hypothetical protein
MFIHRLAALLVLALVASAGPAAAQGGEPSSTDASALANASADAKMPALLPPPCLSCAAARMDVREASAVEAEALPRGAAPLIGGVVGAAVGFVAMRVACADRSCEMADLFGILGGAVIGFTVGKEIEGTLPGRRRW